MPQELYSKPTQIIAEQAHMLIGTTLVLYIALSALITYGVGRALNKNGRIFLIDSFGGKVGLADSVNQLLLVGFYLINAGYVLFTVRSSYYPVNVVESIEFLSVKLGLAILVLGAMHFFNMYAIVTMRKKFVAYFRTIN